MYSDLLENISKVSAHPWRDYRDCIMDKLNEKIRKEIVDGLSQSLQSKDLEDRRKEIEQIIEEERIKWESDKAEFESNPLNWSNNKRRKYRLPTLRGSLNKNRTTMFHSFEATPRVFLALEDAIEELLPQKINDSFIDQFVDIKNMM